MAETRKTVAEMFSRFLNIQLTDDVYDKLIPLVEKVEKSITDDLDLTTVQGQNTLKVLLSTLMAYCWGIGMHPYHNPIEDNGGKPLEVRASKDILVPIKDMQAVRYLKKDKYGRVRKALFETDQNSRVRRQIDDLLEEITVNKWQEEEF
ncbi:MAG: hypothetical protein GY835_20915 [bacterium]|nr:hypothetical protein [bacterium]